MNDELIQTHTSFAEADVSTPYGHIRVVLATQTELQRLQLPGAHPDFDALAVCITAGPVSDFLDSWGTDKNPLFPRDGKSDSIPSPALLPVIRPVALTIIDTVMNGKKNAIFLAYGHMRYEQQQKDGSYVLLERGVFFRPDSAASLVVIIDSDTKKQHLLLTRGMKDGAGGYFSGETLGGSNDKEGEELKKLVLREMIEEIGLTQEELDTAVLENIFEAFVSPGADVESVAGFQLVMSLKTNRIEELKAHIGGVFGEHETIQQILIELPEIPDSLTLQTFNLYVKEWDLIMELTKDLKTRALLEHFARTSIESVTRSILTERLHT